MAIRKTDALILRTQIFRSSSLIVTFYTRHFGKIKGLVKGVRQERETRGALYELFTQIEIIYYEKIRSDLHLVSESFLLESYEPLRKRIETIAYASYFSDLVDQLTELYDPNEKIFELLDFGFRYLASIAPERLCRIFEIHLLKEVGWIPFLDACMQCHDRPVEEGYFSPVQGALLCKKCSSNFPDARLISEETLSAMRYYASHDLEASVRWPLSHKTEKGLEALLQRFFLSRLNKPLKTQVFIEKIRPVLAS